MQWTMPHRVLQIVASLIGLAAVSAFILGVVSAPQRGGRLPGAKAPGAAGPATAIDATDATPLVDERIEGPPPPTPEEIAAAKAKEEEAARKKAEAEAEADRLAAEQAALDQALGAVPPPTLRPVTPPAGNTPPPPEEPIF